MSSGGDLLYAAVQTAWKDDAIASGSTSKQRRANLQRVANIEADVTAVQKKRRRKAQATNNQPLFIAKRKEPKTKKSAMTEKPKFNKKQREKIQERNATMKETYAKIMGAFSAKSVSEKRDIDEFDKARGDRTWNDMLQGRAEFYKEKEDVEDSVFSEADFNSWQKSYDVRSQIKRKLQ